jgi:hypothetical protein
VLADMSAFVPDASDMFSELVQTTNGLDASEIAEARTTHADLLAAVAAQNFLDNALVEKLESMRGGKTCVVWRTAEGMSSQETIVKNYDLLFWCLKVYPDKIPSKFWLAAVVLHIDRKLNLYVGGEANKVGLSLKDGEVLKKHFQHIRALARHNCNSRDAQLQRLKDLVVLGSAGASGSSSSSCAGASGSSPSSCAGSLEDRSNGSVVAPVTGESPAKRSRTGHLGERPEPEGLDEAMEGVGEVPAVSSHGQACMAAAAREKLPGGAKAWSLEDQPLVDPSRVVPANFEEKYHPAFLRLPAACLPKPDARLVGKANFTIYDMESRAVQIQLNNKVFFIVKKSGGAKWVGKTDGSPQVPWSAGANIADSWRMLVEKLEGWSAF